MENVPFSPPDISDDDIEAVVAVLRSGWITTGPVSKAFEADLAGFCGTQAAILQNSCTAALEQALRAAGVGPGDEVVVPAYTFTASASSAIHVGATLRLVDVAPGEYVPSIEQIVAAVTSETKAIVVVDYAGVPYPADELIAALADTVPTFTNPYFGELNRPIVISDGAHSLGGQRGEKTVGQLADMTAFSFHAVKNLTTAEGGALTWSDAVTDSDALYRDLYRTSLHGQTRDARAKMQLGGWEYDILEPGFKSNMPDILAALGQSQLRRYTDVITRRLAIIDQYARLLPGRVQVMPHEASDFRSSAHLAVTRVENANEAERNQIIQRLADQGVASNVHYKPLPMLTAYANLGFSVADYPNAVQTYTNELTLPLFNAMTDAQVARVANTLATALDG